MKNKRGQTIPPRILEATPSATAFLKDIGSLTVEDVVVIYAYAEAIVETVREPLVILDADLRIKTANKSFFDTFNVTKKTTYNKLIFDIGNRQWNIPALKKLLLEILPKNSFFNDFEITHNFQDIGERTMLLNARRIILEGHKTQLILLAIEDITERKQIDRQKDDFIGIASHELKTPLTSMKSFTQILNTYLQKTQDNKPLFLLDKITKQVERMEHIMASFLNVYNIQIGKLSLHKEHFLLDDVLKDLIVTFQYTTNSHELVLEGKTNKKVYADKDRISQVVTNLITNAIKYSPKENKIIITLMENPLAVTVSVQDFGIGISKEQQRLIFERFFRAKGKEEKNIQGLGLGLYIAYEIIKEHMGKMWVESEKEKGSTFYFTLPLNNKKSQHKKLIHN